VAIDRVAHVTGERRERYASRSLRERHVMALLVSGLLKGRLVADPASSEITMKAQRRRMMQKMKGLFLGTGIAGWSEIEGSHDDKRN
jgi:FixJ family two-component response regulator